jgi:aspartyl-tRNA(Asn)/glutamyl-tRNA(Gln) amidotransferase subunit C
VAHLSRLALTDDELKTMAGHLGSVLDYINQLQEVSTEGVEPLAHPFGMQNVFRADEPAPSLPVEAALANAPARDGDFYTVPAVLE